MVSYISVEEVPGVLQTKQKYIGRWREVIEVKTILKHCEARQRPSGVRHVMGSNVAPLCRSRYPVNFVAVDVKSTGIVVDQNFSEPK